MVFVTTFLSCIVFSAHSPVLAADTANQQSSWPDLQPIPNNVGPLDPLLRFMPAIYQEGIDCAPQVWVDATGSMTSTDWVHLTCRKPILGGQLIGQKMKYKDKYALAYTAFYPFDYTIRVGTSDVRSMITVLSELMFSYRF